MTEHRTPYVVECQPEVTLTPQEQRIEKLERYLRLASQAIQAMLDDEGFQCCPNCGWRLKTDPPDAHLDNSLKV